MVFRVSLVVKSIVLIISLVVLFITVIVLFFKLINCLVLFVFSRKLYFGFVPIPMIESMVSMMNKY